MWPTSRGLPNRYFFQFSLWNKNLPWKNYQLHNSINWTDNNITRETSLLRTSEYIKDVAQDWLIDFEVSCFVICMFIQYTQETKKVSSSGFRNWVREQPRNQKSIWTNSVSHLLLNLFKRTTGPGWAWSLAPSALVNIGTSWFYHNWNKTIFFCYFNSTRPLIVNSHPTIEMVKEKKIKKFNNYTCWLVIMLCKHNTIPHLCHEYIYCTRIGPVPDFSWTFPRPLSDLSQTCPGLLLDLSHTFPRPLPDFAQTFPRLLPDLLWISPRLFLDLSCTCPRPFPNLSWTSPGPFPDLFWTSPRPVPDFSQTSPRSFLDLSCISSWLVGSPSPHFKS